MITMIKMDVLLSKLYYSPASATGYSRPVILWREAKKHIPKLTLKQVQEWYWGQDVPSRFQQAKKHFNRSLFVTRSVNVQWLADLADFGNLTRYNNNYRYLLVVQDLFSRKLVGLVALKRKLSQEVAQALQHIIKEVGHVPQVFYTDQGREFFGECQKLYSKYNIEHATTNDITQKAAPVERAILVVKQRLYKIMNSQNTLKWTDKLNDVMTAYNNSYNRTLGMSPMHAGLPKNQNEVFRRSVAQRELQMMQENPLQKFQFHVGTTVRILKDQPFGKSYVGNYSQVVYTISKQEIKGGVPVYALKEFLTGEPLQGIFYEQELTPVKVKEPKERPKKIHSFRLFDNKEQVQVSYHDKEGKFWVDYSKLLGL